MTRFASFALDFAIEAAQVAARAYVAKRILPGLTKALRIIELEARICMLERQIDSVLNQARRGDVLRRRAG